jgi:phage baseplate assembly protein W
MSKTDLPHFRYPFRFGTGLDKHALVNEQHSEEEIIDCVLAIVKTPRGWRDDLPEFGINDPLFSEQPIRVEDITSALDEWESRAAYRVTTQPDFRERLAVNLQIEVKSRVDA